MKKEKKSEYSDSSSTTPQTTIQPTTASSSKPVSTAQCKVEDEIRMDDSSIIPDQYITSSNMNSSQGTTKNSARLYALYGWHAYGQNEWLQVNIGKIAQIIGIATQGHSSYGSSDHDYWVIEFKLSYSIEIIDRTPKTWYNNGQLLQANNGRDDTVVCNAIQPPFKARYVRVHPKNWHKCITMRMELYESKENEEPCSYALGMEGGMIEDTQLEASSSYTYKDVHYLAKRARLGDRLAWVTNKTDKEQWLQIDLLHVKKIFSIATRGMEGAENPSWVKSYYLTYSNHSYHSLNRKSVQHPTSFQGNTDGKNIVYNTINPLIIAQIVRVVPTEWNNFIALRLELYGCPLHGSLMDLTRARMNTRENMPQIH